jgi:hypothetical protein
MNLNKPIGLFLIFLEVRRETASLTAIRNVICRIHLLQRDFFYEKKLKPIHQ